MEGAWHDMVWEVSNVDELIFSVMFAGSLCWVLHLFFVIMLFLLIFSFRQVLCACESMCCLNDMVILMPNSHFSIA